MKVTAAVLRIEMGKRDGVRLVAHDPLEISACRQRTKDEKAGLKLPTRRSPMSLRTACPLALLLLASTAVLAPARAEDAPPAAAANAPTDGFRPATLFADGVSHGGFGAPDFRVSSVAGKAAVFVGARGAWLVDHHLIIGGGGAGIATQLAAPLAAQDTTGNAVINFGYGGLWLGWIFGPEWIVHPVASVLVGGGGLGFRLRDGGDLGGRTSAVFVLEPELALELNLFEHMRVALGASYRMVRGVDSPGLANSDVSGFSGLLLVKFGQS